MELATVIESAVAEYMCQHKSVGVFRLTEDVLKRPDVRKALGLKLPPAPGSNEWWRAYYAVMDAVRSLEAEGLAKVVDGVVVNWSVGGCL